MAARITHDEWLAEIEKLIDRQKTDREGPEGFSSRDLAEALSLGQDAAQRRLRDLVDSGAVEFTGYQTRLNRVGRPHKVPVYRPVRTPEAPSKASDAKGSKDTPGRRNGRRAARG